MMPERQNADEEWKDAPKSKLIKNCLWTNVSRHVMNDFLMFSPTPTTRGHPYKLFVPFTSRNCGQHFFSVRVIEPWNGLKFTSDEFASVKRFKSALQRTDLSLYLKYSD